MMSTVRATSKAVSALNRDECIVRLLALEPHPLASHDLTALCNANPLGRFLTISAF